MLNFQRVCLPLQIKQVNTRKKAPKLYQIKYYIKNIYL